MIPDTTYLILKKGRQYLLALTLLLSFFVLSGYVNSNRPVPGMVKTEALAGKHTLSKSSISYKRGIIALQRCGQTGIVAHNLHALILRQQQIANIKYHYQQRLFSCCKSTFAFHLVTYAYPRGADYPVIG